MPVNLDYQYHHNSAFSSGPFFMTNIHTYHLYNIFNSNMSWYVLVCPCNSDINNANASRYKSRELKVRREGKLNCHNNLLKLAMWTSTPKLVNLLWYWKGIHQKKILQITITNSREDQWGLSIWHFIKLVINQCYSTKGQPYKEVSSFEAYHCSLDIREYSLHFYLIPSLCRDSLSRQRLSWLFFSHRSSRTSPMVVSFISMVFHINSLLVHFFCQLFSIFAIPSLLEW